MVDHVHLLHQGFFVGKVFPHIVEQFLQRVFKLLLATGPQERSGELNDNPMLMIDGIVSRVDLLFPWVFQFILPKREHRGPSRTVTDLFSLDPNRRTNGR